MITGYVDGVANGVLFGWVANLDAPERLEQVVVQGPAGLVRRFNAFLPRHDVNQALSKPGRFGFAIPLHLLDGLGRVVRVTAADGSVLNNGEVVRLPDAMPPLDGAGPAGAHWVFLHIQKTAGTSLRAMLAQAMGPGRSLFVYGDGFSGLTAAELPGLPRAQRAALRLVVGHCYFGTVAPHLPGPARHATILRDPMARLRSHYRHHVRARTAFDVPGGPDAAAVATGGLTDEFDNLMVRMVAGLGTADVPLGAIDAGHVNQAVEAIRSSYRFVALTERLDEHAPLLCAAMGIAADRVPRENAQPPGDAAPGDVRVDWPRVAWRNRFDAMLYRAVQHHGLCGRDLAAGRGAIGTPVAGAGAHP